MRVEVSLALNTNDNFTYEVLSDAPPVQRGTRVLVPVWNRIVPGWIVNTSSPYTGRVKAVLGIIESGYHPGPEFQEFVQRVAESFLVSQGRLLDLSLSPAMRSRSGLMCRSPEGDFPLFKKSSSEILKLGRLSTLRLYYKNRDVADGSRRPLSGEPPPESPPRTHTVYLNHRRVDFYREIWESDQSRGKSTCILLPNNLSMKRYQDELSDLTIYNSNLKNSRREEIWTASRGEEPLFIGGGESGLFLPLSNPGTVIIEKPGSFFYSRNVASGIDLREAARIKAEIFGAELLEGGAGLLPVHVSLSKSVKTVDERPDPPLPVKIKKLLPGIKVPPAPVVESIIGHFTKNRSVLVVVSKKGSRKFLFCPGCSSVFHCPSCGSSVSVLSGSSLGCVSCSYTAGEIPECSKCGKDLKVIEDLSVASLKTKLSKSAGEENVISYDPDSEPVKGKKIVILTPVEAGCIGENSFDHVVMVKPESFFDLNTYNGGEQIWSFVNGLKDVLLPGGAIEVYTVFHFHYSLKKINEEEEYLKREMKYREMFRLPPYFEVFDLVFSDRNMRKLAEKMRTLVAEYGSAFSTVKSYLISREKKRGFYKGNVRIHIPPGTLTSTGVRDVRGIKIIRVVS